jgi:hypothetical protein
MQFRIIVLVITLCMLTGFALADSAVPQTPETQGFVTSTIMQALGTATETDSLSWVITNDGFDGLPNIPPLFVDLVSIYSMSYTEDTIADQGLVTYAKQGAVDTQAKVEGQWNTEMVKTMDFVGLDTGRMVSDEEQVLDGAGTFYPSELTFICPFASESSAVLPSFCNIVQEGSSVDLTVGSLATTAKDRFVTAISAQDEIPLPSGLDLPVSDAGVESDYQVKLTGFGDVPAMGSADAFINVHIQEGRGPLFEADDGEDGDGINQLLDPKAEDMTYSEDSTAAGDITLFQKTMSYNSKFTGGRGPGRVIILLPLLPE